MQKPQVVRVRNERGQVRRDEFISYQLCDLVLPDQKACSTGDYILREGERLLSHSFIMDTMRKLMGRTLTIIDASIVDKEHNKAIKDLIRQVYSDEMEFAAEWAFDQNVIKAVVDEVGELEGVSVEEVLGVH